MLLNLYEIQNIKYRKINLYTVIYISIYFNYIIRNKNTNTNINIYTNKNVNIFICINTNLLNITYIVVNRIYF